MSGKPLLSYGFLIHGGVRRDNPHEAVQNRQLIDGWAGEPGDVLAVLVMNMSCFMAISRYLPRFCLNSVAVTIIVCASILMYRMFFFIFIIRESHEIVKKPHDTFTLR